MVQSDEGSNGPAVVPLPARKTDEERAADYKARLRPHMDEIAKILGEAARDGLRVTFNIGNDGFGRYSITALEIVKPL